MLEQLGKNTRVDPNCNNLKCVLQSQTEGSHQTVQRVIAVGEQEAQLREMTL